MKCICAMRYLTDEDCALGLWANCKFNLLEIISNCFPGVWGIPVYKLFGGLWNG